MAVGSVLGQTWSRFRSPFSSFIFYFFHFHPLHRAESAAFDFYFQSTLVANTFPYGKEKKKMMMMMMMKRKKKKKKEKKKKKKKKSIVDGGQVCAR